MAYPREKLDNPPAQVTSVRNVCLRILDVVRANHDLFQSLCAWCEAKEVELQVRGYPSHVREALDGWRSAESAPWEPTQYALCGSMLEFLGFPDFLSLACRAWTEEFGKSSDLLIELERKSLRIEIHRTAIRALSSRLLRTLVPSRGNVLFVIATEDLSDSQLRRLKEDRAGLGPMPRRR